MSSPSPAEARGPRPVINWTVDGDEGFEEIKRAIQDKLDQTSPDKWSPGRLATALLGDYHGRTFCLCMKAAQPTDLKELGKQLDEQWHSFTLTEETCKTTRKNLKGKISDKISYAVKKRKKLAEETRSSTTTISQETPEGDRKPEARKAVSVSASVQDMTSPEPHAGEAVALSGVTTEASLESVVRTMPEDEGDNSNRPGIYMKSFSSDQLLLERFRNPILPYVIENYERIYAKVRQAPSMENWVQERLLDELDSWLTWRTWYDTPKFWVSVMALYIIGANWEKDGPTAGQFCSSLDLAEDLGGRHDPLFNELLPLLFKYNRPRYGFGALFSPASPERNTYRPNVVAILCSRTTARYCSGVPLTFLLLGYYEPTDASDLRALCDLNDEPWAKALGELAVEHPGIMREQFNYMDCVDKTFFQTFLSGVYPRLGDTLLHYALRCDLYCNRAMHLLALAPELARVRNVDGDTPLHLAARNELCSVETVQKLVDVYPDGVYEGNKNGHTPLAVLNRGRLERIIRQVASSSPSSVINWLIRYQGGSSYAMSKCSNLMSRCSHLMSIISQNDATSIVSDGKTVDSSIDSWLRRFQGGSVSSSQLMSIISEIDAMSNLSDGRTEGSSVNSWLGRFPCGSVSSSQLKSIISEMDAMIIVPDGGTEETAADDDDPMFFVDDGTYHTIP